MYSARLYFSQSEGCQGFSLDITLAGNLDCRAAGNSSSCDSYDWLNMSSCLCRSILDTSLALIELMVVSTCCMCARSVLGTIFTLLRILGRLD